MDDAGHGHDDLAKLLAKFPGPVTLNSSRWKWFRLLAIATGFTALGVWMIKDAVFFSDSPLVRYFAQFLAMFGLHLDAAAIVAAVGWITSVFFGFGLVICFINLLPMASVLTLSIDGFAMSSAFRRKSYNWTNVDRFAVAEVRYGFGAQKFVGYDDRLASRSAIAKANLALAGRNSALPDTYGLSVDSLASLMSLWRQRALASSLH